MAVFGRKSKEILKDIEDVNVTGKFVQVKKKKKKEVKFGLVPDLSTPGTIES